ncbi:uncharacterized protein LOC136077686 [Hydra vulgaris]|uniref:Uncharacterized protein LOC136077686 n=1 Tax=Hydra vulgaris TaxID=6087 RepID=A0ABM4BG66_HYDVU
MNASLYTINCFKTSSSIPYQTQKDGTLYVAIVLLFISSVPNVLMNVYIIAMTFYSKDLHSSSNILMASTSFFDLLNGLFSFIPYAAILIMTFSKKHNCILYLVNQYAYNSFSTVSLIMVYVNSIDRYVAVFNPFFYHKYIKNNPRLYIKFACVTSSLFLLIGGLSFLTENKLLIHTIILFISPIFIVTVLYIHIRLYFRARFVRKVILAQVSGIFGFSEENRPKNKINRKKKICKELKTNKLTLMVCISTCIAHIPLFLLLFLWFSKPLSRKWDWTYNFNLWAHILTLMKSLINPIIYLNGSKSLRKGINRVWQST